MATAILQDPRPLAIETPFGEDVLLLNSFSGVEELSSPYVYDLELSSLQEGLPAEDIVGRPVSVRLETARGGKRFFHGIVSTFSQGLRGDTFTTYYAKVVPWLWLLKFRRNCRIMTAPETRDDGKTTPEILQQVFKDLADSCEYPCDFQLKLNEDYAPHEFCVQYRETDFNFISRLMEEEGIFYYFKHEESKHTLVLADNASAYFDLPDSKVELPEPGNVHEHENQIRTWQHNYELHPGVYAQSDYNFETTEKPLASERSKAGFTGMSGLELYDAYGRHPDDMRGQFLARMRMEEHASTHSVAHGSSKCDTFTPGGRFSFAYHRNQKEIGQAYALTRVSTHMQLSNYEAGVGSSFNHSNEFECIPAKTVFRPRSRAVRPRIDGVQTAIVIGPKDETQPQGKGKDKEIYVDKHGRVKVRFHWMREGDQAGEQKSCWIRVSQGWAGGGFGGMTIPRIGHEVIVSFIEGDPDRPIISGCVYNGASMPSPSNAGREVPSAAKKGQPKYPGNQPPGDIPAAAMMTSFKSNSVGGSGSNEITMNDEGGKEGLLIKAQKDEVHTVGHDREDSVANDESRSVGHNRFRSVGVDETVEVGNNQAITIGNNRTTTIASNDTETVGSNQTITVGANQSTSVGANQTNAIGSNQTTTVGMNVTDMVGLMATELVGAIKSTSVPVYAVTVGAAMNTMVGHTQMEQVGKIKKVMVGDAFEIVCGASKLTMKKDGTITLEGKNILISGSGPVKVKGSIIDLN